GELLGYAVLPGAGGPHLLRDVAHGRDLETVRQLAEIVEVHDLSDQAASDDPYAQSAGHIHPGRNTRAEARWNVPTTLYERVDGGRRGVPQRRKRRVVVPHQRYVPGHVQSVLML